MHHQLQTKICGRKSADEKLADEKLLGEKVSLNPKFPCWNWTFDCYTAGVCVICNAGKYLGQY